MRQYESIFVAGARGMVGSAIVRRLQALGYRHLHLPSRRDLDLLDSEAVRRFLAAARPDYVFDAAARVGGIHANSSCPAEFIRENLAIQTNLIHESWRHQVKKFLFLGSSCIYPRDASQPLREEALLTGPLEPTNSPYAVAKIAGIEMCRAYRRQYGFRAITLMPTNLYGPNDNFDLETAHVLPALLRRFHEARLRGSPAVQVWGSGKPRREFLHVDDLADAAVTLMRDYDGEDSVNVGTGRDLTIAELSDLLKRVTGFRGRIEWNRTMPDGTPRKLLDVSRLVALGWRPQIDLDDGIRHTYEWYLENCGEGRVPAA